MQLESFLETNARRMPQKTAIVCGEQRLTYAELEKYVDSIIDKIAAAQWEDGYLYACYSEPEIDFPRVFANSANKQPGPFPGIRASKKAF